MQETTIGNYKIMFEDEAREGITYLEDYLDRAESEVIFHYAYEKGKAPFQDYNRRKYILAHNSNGVYVLDRK